MEDFIRPNHNPEPKLKPKKTKHIRETLFIVCMIVCLAVGFVSGYVAKKTVPTNSTSKNAESIIDEAYEILDEAWLNPNDKDVDIKGLSGRVAPPRPLQSAFLPPHGMPGLPPH